MNSSKVIHRKLGRHKAWGLASDEKRTIELDTRLKGYRHRNGHRQYTATAQESR